MSNYSPYKAAIAALHTPEAIAYYKHRSQEDLQTLVIAAVATGAAIYEAAVFTYQFGIFVRAWYEASRPQPEVTAIVPVQSAAIEIFTVDYDNTDEVIDGEIVDYAPILLLSAAPQITLTSQSTLNQAWIANNITPLLTLSDGSVWEQKPSSKSLPPAKSKKPATPKAKPAPKTTKTRGRKATTIA